MSRRSRARSSSSSNMAMGASTTTSREPLLCTSLGSRATMAAHWCAVNPRATRNERRARGPTPSCASQAKASRIKPACSVVQ